MTTTTADAPAPPRPAWPHDDAWLCGPVARIVGAPGARLPLPRSGRNLDGFALQAGAGSLDLTGFLQATASDAFVVLKDGALVFEAYAPGFTSHTPHILMSASKAVTGVLAGILQGDARLDVEAAVSTYVPEVLGTAYDGATLRQLMDMRAVIRLTEAQLTAYDRANAREEGPDGPPSGLQAFFRSLAGPAHPHGGPFSYISPNTDLLGWAIERATGQTVADLLSELLWAPMGAQDHAWITLDHHGAPQCTRGICATAHDVARLGQLVLQGGRLGGAAVIPEAWLDDLVNGGDRKAWTDGEWGRSFLPVLGPDVRYRAGWYSVGGETPHLFAMGVYGQNLFVDLDAGVVMAKLSSLKERIDPTALWLTHRAWDEVRRVLG